MGALILWYLSLTLAGWAAFPLAFRIFPALSDRGYAFSRSIAVLGWGFLFWFLSSLGILRNDQGGILAAQLILVGLSCWALWSFGWARMFTWFRRRWKVILSVEALFAMAFAGMALVRSANPEIMGTEKPMELAFINAIMTSSSMPPHDPWLSGYSISYYYFGYVMVAMLAKFLSVQGSVAFNLGITMVYSLSALGAYGMVFNLLAFRLNQGGPAGGEQRRLSYGLPLLGPVFVLLVGNLEGFLEVLHARGLFWTQNRAGEWVSTFWRWLDMQELSMPPPQPFSWVPSRYLWWWRASRVVQDYDFAGGWKEVIDEFPSFSFILGDLHPHVLVMPFAFLAMALALNLFLGGFKGQTEWFRRRVYLSTLAWAALILLVVGLAGLWIGAQTLSLRPAILGVASILLGAFTFLNIQTSEMPGLSIFTNQEAKRVGVGFSLHLSPLGFVSGAVILGGLAFLNTWDFPFYLTLFSAAYAVARARHDGWSLARIKDFFAIAVLVSAVSILLYLPFYLGFSSQAGGVLPSMIYTSRGAHLWVMFAPLLLPMAAYLVYLLRRYPQSASVGWGFGTTLGLLLGLGAGSLLLAVGIAALPGIGDFFVANYGAPSIGELVEETFTRKLVYSGGWITMTLFTGLFVSLLWPRREVDGGGAESLNDPGEPATLPAETVHRDNANLSLNRAHTFTLLLGLVGGLLVLGPEFFYLRDQFGWRINTIFKFYFQAWLMWGVVAAFGSAVLLQELASLKALLYRLALLLVIAAGMTYTILGLWTKTSGFTPPWGYTLDGASYRERQSPEEMAAIQWLKSAPPGVVAESVGGSYSAHARVAAFSGYPTVLGWIGHESQWRGGAREMGSRQSDIQRLYCTRDWIEARSIIDQYDIRYIFVGSLERSTYAAETCPGGLDDSKFERQLEVAFQQGDAVIYETY